ncbi:unnamed protein product, partial [Sphacelaria rigidula]
SKRRDAERKTCETFRNPRQLCREYALEDGRKSREVAAVLVQKRKYPEARARLDDAQACFNWAGSAEMEVRELRRVLEKLEMRENSTRGDSLAEGVASKLQLFTLKDYSALFSRLYEAATAYQVARDHEGAQVIRLVTSGLRSIQSAEMSWLDLVVSLNDRRYPTSVRQLGGAKYHIAQASKGLPFVNPSLARAIKILSPAGNLAPVDIVAELAALDGLRDHTKALLALDQARIVV